MKRKCVLVTGASRGIGRDCALSFARNGYSVFINSCRSLKELNQVQQQIVSEGGTCHVLPGDVGRSQDVAQMFEQLKKETNRIDVLINNAGISYIGLLTDMTDTDWLQIINTNLSSVFYCSRAAIPYMVSQQSGKIINISSMWGTSGASCEAAYSASKAGVHGLTKSLAKELAPSNIQVNAIACGVIDTVMNAALNAEDREVLMDEIPAGRFASPGEVAALALDLAKGHSYLTGQIIGLDGGFI